MVIKLELQDHNQLQINAADTDITKFDFINGREFTVSSVNTTATRPFILVNTTGLTFPDDAFS